MKINGRIPADGEDIRFAPDATVSIPPNAKVLDENRNPIGTILLARIVDGEIEAEIEIADDGPEAQTIREAVNRGRFSIG